MCPIIPLTFIAKFSFMSYNVVSLFVCRRRRLTPITCVYCDKTAEAGITLLSLTGSSRALGLCFGFAVKFDNKF